MKPKHTEEWQRHKVQVKLRWPKELRDQVHARAHEQELDVSEYLARLARTDLGIV